MNHEGTLIAFTLLSQLVAGSTLLYAILHFTRSDEVFRFPSGFRLRTAELLLLVLLLVAISISFLHLGNPRQAVRALNHLGSSWISREILSLVVLSLSLFLLLPGRRLVPARHRILSVLFLFSLFSGAALIIVMVRLYMVPAVVTWNSWYTPLSFILTSFILGICFFLVYLASVRMEWSGSRRLITILMVFLLMEAVISAANQYRLSQLSMTHFNPFLLENIHLRWTIIRVALIVSVVGLLGLIQRNSTIRPIHSVQKMWMGMAILLILVEQIAGRWLFFTSFVKVGI